jgi:hypothetical protein
MKTPLDRSWKAKVLDKKLVECYTTQSICFIIDLI